MHFVTGGMNPALFPFAVLVLFLQGCSREPTTENFFDEPRPGVDIKIHVPKEWRDGHHLVHVVPLCELTDGQIGSPLVLTQQTRKGFMDRVYMETVTQNRNVGIYSPFAVPKSPLVKRCLILIKNAEVWDGWWIFEIPAEKIQSLDERNEFGIPDPTILPKLDQHANREAIQRMLELHHHE